MMEKLKRGQVTTAEILNRCCWRNPDYNSKDREPRMETTEEMLQDQQRITAFFFSFVISSKCTYSNDMAPEVQATSRCPNWQYKSDEVGNVLTTQFLERSIIFVVQNLVT